MTQEWICLKPTPTKPCNQLNTFADSCGRCGGTRYLTDLIQFENKLEHPPSSLRILVGEIQTSGPDVKVIINAQNSGLGNR